MKKAAKKTAKKPVERPKAKRCELCNKSFIPSTEKNKSSAFLCQACIKAAKEKGGWWSHRTCAHCGRRWLVWKNRAGLCPDCCQGWCVSKKQKNETSPAWICPAGFKKDKKHKCKNCGKEFMPYSITEKNGRITCVAGWRTCSWACTAELLKKEEKSV